MLQYALPFPNGLRTTDALRGLLVHYTDATMPPRVRVA